MTRLLISSNTWKGPVVFSRVLETHPAPQPASTPLDTANFLEKMEGFSLREMCETGDLEGVGAALGRGEDVNQRKENRTVLMDAAYDGQESVVEFLLQRPGLDVNLTDSDGDTALHDACNSGHSGVVRRLLAHQSLTCTNLRNVEGERPLMVAVYHGNVECVRELVAVKGVDLDTRDNKGRSLEFRARGQGHLAVWEVVRDEQRRMEEQEKDNDNRRYDIIQVIRSDFALEAGKAALDELKARHNEEERELKSRHQEEEQEVRKRKNERVEELLSNRLEEVLREEEELEGKRRADLKREMEQKLRKVRQENIAKEDELAKEVLERQKELARRNMEAEKAVMRNYEVKEARMVAESEEMVMIRKREHEELVQEFGREEGQGKQMEKTKKSLKEEENTGKVETDEKKRMEEDESTPACPVCFELLLPPTHVYQCGRGHLLCGACKPNLQECPSRCGQPLLPHRATGMEAHLRNRAG